MAAILERTSGAFHEEAEGLQYVAGLTASMHPMSIGFNRTLARQGSGRRRIHPHEASAAVEQVPRLRMRLQDMHTRLRETTFRLQEAERREKKTIERIRTKMPSFSCAVDGDVA